MPALPSKATLGRTLGFHRQESLARTGPLLTLNTCSFCNNHSFSAWGPLALMIFSLLSLFMSVTTKSKNSEVIPQPLDSDSHITLYIVFSDCFQFSKASCLLPEHSLHILAFIKTWPFHGDLASLSAISKGGHFLSHTSYITEAGGWVGILLISTDTSRQLLFPHP